MISKPKGCQVSSVSCTVVQDVSSFSCLVCLVTLVFAKRVRIRQDRRLARQLSSLGFLRNVLPSQTFSFRNLISSCLPHLKQLLEFPRRPEPVMSMLSHQHLDLNQPCMLYTEILCHMGWTWSRYVHRIKHLNWCRISFIKQSDWALDIAVFDAREALEKMIRGSFRILSHPFRQSNGQVQSSSRIQENSKVTASAEVFKHGFMATENWNITSKAEQRPLLE